MNRNILTSEDASHLAQTTPEVTRNRLLQVGPALPKSMDTESSGEGPKPDNYFDRLLKYIPAEIISTYILLAAPVPDTFAGTAVRRAYWILLLIGLVLTPVFARQVLKVERKRQICLTTVGFVVFVAGQGGAFALYDWWKGYYALGATALFLLLVAIVHLPPLPQD